MTRPRAYPAALSPDGKTAGERAWHQVTSLRMSGGVPPPPIRFHGEHSDNRT